ncbi:hypothetical protein CYL18_14780 [Pradoshia eiseniae]|uniref:Uncharacterized protein n=1 Tax=Pradoshia eiseniae TaxID=2064768 RepID=A0A2S7MWU2_9BACI|nr:hypothetical protein CYL18_14780 [Pradoshia eiseniae]
MNRELLAKLKMLTNLIIVVDTDSSIKKNEHQTPINISIRRGGNPRKSRAEKAENLRNQLNNLFD